MNAGSRSPERRLDRRIPLGSRATIRLARGEDVVAQCVELSVGGMTLRGAYVPRESEILEVEVLPPAGGIARPPLVVRLRVGHCHAIDAGAYEIGGAIVGVVA